MAACFGSSLSAQFYVTGIQYFPTGVSNEGVVVGSTDQNTPFRLWHPKEGGEFVTIGGVSAGNGVGGVAFFSSDGKTVVAPMRDENVPLSTEWEDESIASTYNYTITEISRVANTKDMVAIGVKADNSAGIVLKSTNSGSTWRKSTDGLAATDVFVSIGFLNYARALIGGHNGKIYSLGRGDIWYPIDLHPADNTDKVKTYWAIDFILEQDNTAAYNGVVGMELEDGTGAVWYTNDQGDNFHVAEGVTGVPTSITNMGGNYFMTTREGHILKSTDKGATWAQIFETDGGATLNRIQFSKDNTQNGIAVSYGRIYYTNDTGATWTKVDLPAMGMWEDYNWSDVCWVDAETAYITGSMGIYLTEDAGKTWEESHKLPKGKIFRTIAVEPTKGVVIAGGDEGQFSRKSPGGSMAAYLAGTYDIENEIWTPLKTFGYASGETMSSPYAISDNGQVIVGQASTYKLMNESSAVHSHATAWVDGKPIDLGSKFAENNKFSRAVASNFDGSVIVGLQDIFGPWYASIWRKNEAGDYEQKMLLKDGKTEADIKFDYKTPEGRDEMMANLVGQASSISIDGKWIGGRGESGNTALKGAWILNEETGEIRELTGEYGGYVSGINSDASFVVGYDATGTSAWMWTEKTGYKSLDKYLEEDLGFDLEGYYIGSAYTMSPNGRYLAGYCLKGMSKFGYFVDLSGEGDVSTGLIEQINAAVYPNPVADELHIDVPFDNVKTVFTLYDMQGRIVRTMTTTSVSNVMNVSDIASGLYILNVEADNARRAFKVEIR